MIGKKVTALLGIILISALVLQFSIKTTYSSPTHSIPAIVSTDWLKANLGLTNLVVLDVRSPDVYNASHIPGAINVPEGMWYANPPFGANSPWMEMPTEDYLFELIGNAGIRNDSLVVVVGGTSGPKEIIVYCGVGGYASTMYFVLSEVLNYTNVKFYDGSAQEWTSDPTLPVVYEDLGSEYMKLQSNHEQLRLDYIIIQSNLTELIGKCFALESIYNTLSVKYDELEAKYDELAKTTTPAYLTYLFVATTITFAIITIYLVGKVKTSKG